MVRLATAQVNDVSFFFGNRESSHRLGGFNRLLAGIGFEGFSQKQSAEEIVPNLNIKEK
jgi:hypothetical protein